MAPAGRISLETAVLICSAWKR